MSTIDLKEVEKFSAIADEWWSESGKFKPLHQFNPIRLSYITRKISEHFKGVKFSDLKIADIGCGGGLMCEPLARLGAQLTGVDAAEKNIAVAKIHAEKSQLKINYLITTVEDLAQQQPASFDVVMALEIIEHVADVKTFIEACASLVKPGGILLIATMNRTIKSLLLAKIAAEYVLRFLPIGTHDWKKFLKPSQINEYAAASGMELKEIMGFSYDLLNKEWRENSCDIEVNYISYYVRCV